MTSQLPLPSFWGGWLNLILHNLAVNHLKAACAAAALFLPDSCSQATGHKHACAHTHTDEIKHTMSDCSSSLPKLVSSCRPWRTLLGRALAASPSPEVAALARSTVAITDIHTGPPGDNVIPDTAVITFNFRLLPGRCRSPGSC